MYIYLIIIKMKNKKYNNSKNNNWLIIIKNIEKYYAYLMNK